MKFVANDGKIFETMEECEEYETSVNFAPLIKILCTEVTFFNADGKEVPFPDTDDKIDVEKFLEGIWYIRIPYSLSHYFHNSAILEFMNYYGIDMPINGGVYRYNENDGTWHSYAADYDAFWENWGPMKEWVYLYD